MTERQIQKMLTKYLLNERSHSIAIPNFYPPRWHETDLFTIRNSLCYEFEIKVTRSDFFSDRRKINKQSSLLAGMCVPNLFYYVVPEKMIKVDEVPKWAGLMYVSKWGVIVTHKRAPKLHDKEVSPEIYKAIAASFSNRVSQGVFDTGYSESAITTIDAEPLFEFNHKFEDEP